jgi:NitT/TauT family transport system substrate-binding protein
MDLTDLVPARSSRTGRNGKHRSTRLGVVGIAAVAVVATATACSSSGGATSAGGAATTSGGAAAASTTASSAASGAAASSAASSVSGKTYKITLAETSPAADMQEHWVALDAGFFKQQGIDVTLTTAQSGTAVVQTVLSGAAQVGVTASQSIISADKSNGGLLMFGASLSTFPYDLVSGKGITSASQLKGKSIAISQTGSASQYGVQLALEKLGISASSVTLRNIGGETARLQAVKSGTVAATVASVEHRPEFDKDGLTTLTSLSDLNLEFSDAVYAAKASFLKDNPDFQQRFRTALNDARTMMKDPTKKAQVMAILAKHFKLQVSDPIIAAAYQFTQSTSPLVYPEGALITNASMESSLKIVGSSLKVSDIVTPTGLAK